MNWGTKPGATLPYHGPGTDCRYPIVDLGSAMDLHAYLRFLEQVLICSLGSLGLAASRRPGKTGIWLGTRKIAAIGRGGENAGYLYGFALN